MIDIFDQFQTNYRHISTKYKFRPTVHFDQTLRMTSCLIRPNVAFDEVSFDELLWIPDLDLYQQCYVLQKIEEFKDFSRHLSDFPVLFKAYLIFKDFSRKPSKFKYFSSLCKPCIRLELKQFTENLFVL